MRVKNKELRQRRHRKEQAVKAAAKSLREQLGERKTAAPKPVEPKKAAPKKPAAPKATEAKKPAPKKKAEPEAPAAE